MKKSRRVTFLLIAAGSLMHSALVFGQTPGAGRGGGGGGRGGAAAPRVSVRLENWGRISLAAPGTIGWRIGILSSSLRPLTFWDAAAKIDALQVAFIEGSSQQDLSLEIPKKIDYNLAPGELLAVRDRLRSLNLQMLSYFTPVIGPDESSARKLFQFAKGLGVETIVSSPDPASLALIDKLATEFGINVAIENRSRKDTPSYWNAEGLLKATEGRSKRIGAYADTGAWMQEGLKPLAELAAIKGRLMGVKLRDRSALGAKGHDVPLGSGAADLSELVAEVHRIGLKPSLIMVDSNGAKDPAADLARSIEGLDKALRPITGEYVRQHALKTPPYRPDLLTSPEERRRMETVLSDDLKRYELTMPEEMQKIEAALPGQAPAKPKRPRKLLVMDLNVIYNGHLANRFGVNYALDLMGRKTGAFEVVQSNDVDNLKYDRIKQFDAVYLNNTVGGLLMIDQQLRDGLLRFVREGGGLAGNHATSHTAMDWPEFNEMIGTFHGHHRQNDEKAVIKIDDPNSPLTAAFGGKEFLHQDEFFRYTEGVFSREKVHVLLSMDVQKTDMNQGTPCSRPCSRPDNDYALSWIHNYGKGRVFFLAVGHRPTLLHSPAMASYFLAGIQFILGDLEADTTPSARLPAGKSK